MRITAFGRVAPAIAVALLTACGGSGGGGDGDLEPLTDADFAATYFVVRHGGTGTTGSMNTATGTLAAGGAGTADLTVTVSDDGTVSGPASFGFLYDVASDGALDFRSGGDPFESGGLARDGACALLAALSPGGVPRVLVLLRQGGIHGLASLSGSYHAASLLGLEGTGTVALAGRAAFDGTGVGSLNPLTFNEMGTVNTGGVAATYTVDADGASVLTLRGAEFAGGVVEGGAAAVWGGSTTTGQGCTLIAVVRAASAADQSTFRGEYWVVRLARELSTSKFVAQFGTAIADGAGLVTFRLATNRDGTITAATALASGDAYTVDPDGELTFLGTHPLRGGISADGRFAVLGGGTASGTDPAIMVLRRK